MIEHYDFICDEGMSSLRLLQRNPIDPAHTLRGFRVHVRCSDCVGALDVNADNWASFAGLFTHDYDACGSAAWISPAGEWKLHLEKDDHRIYTITSELDSLHYYHRWLLRTQFKMSEDRFRVTSDGVLEFLAKID